MDSQFQIASRRGTDLYPNRELRSVGEGEEKEEIGFRHLIVSFQPLTDPRSAYISIPVLV